MFSNNKKQKLVFLSKLTLLAGLTLPTILSGVISCAKDNSASIDNQQKPNQPSIGDSNYPDQDSKPNPSPDTGIATPDPGPVEPEKPKPVLPVVLPENTNFFKTANINSVSYTHLTLPTTVGPCRSRWSPYH